MSTARLGGEKERYIASITSAILIIFVFSTLPVWAVQLPSSADPSRIKPLKKPIPDKIPSRQIVPRIGLGSGAPDSAKQVAFRLRQVRLEGMTVFEEKQIADLYQSSLGREITLDTIWQIAERITKRYQNAGYFLSRAYIPEQEIEGGVVTIRLVEGYIAEVALEDAPTAVHSLVQKLIERVKAKRPLNAYDLESFMLHMNALPKKQYRAFVEPIKGATAGTTRLLLRPLKESGNGSIVLNNFGSLFLGPYQGMVTYQDSFLPLQKTTLSVLNTFLQPKELIYSSLRHAIPIAPGWEIELFGNYVISKPGDILETHDIKNTSAGFGVGVSWQPVRLRRENLIFTLQLTGKETDSNMRKPARSVLSRDRIRAIRGSINYDVGDGWNGYNYFTLNVNQGLKILGSSEKGDLDLSRDEATPHFTTAQLDYTRQQMLYGNLMAVGRLSGQLSSASLYSSEEFGYGGQAFGRAYDSSEITGDHGAAASLEVYYLGRLFCQEISFIPYAFYDIGWVWDEEASGEDETASSAGVGVRLRHNLGFSLNAGVAWPLTRKIDNPIYSSNAKHPRISFQLSYRF